MIQTRPINPGEKLPSERELAVFFDVQRLTVRTGLKVLLDEGVIYSKERQGYFVSRPRIPHSVHQLKSVTEAIEELGYEVENKLRVFEERVVDEDLSKKIKLAPGEKYYYIERVRFVNGEAISLDWSAIPTYLLPGIESFDFEKQSLYSIIKDHYQLDMYFSKQKISVVNCTEAIAEVFSLTIEDKVIKQQGLIVSQNNEPQEYSVAYMLIDRFSYIGFGEGGTNNDE